MAARRLFRTHRAFGLGLAVVALVLAVTGLLLNHSDDLHLAQRKVHAAWLLALYGIEAPHPGAAYPAGASWVSQWGGQLFLDATPLPGASDTPGAPAAPLLASTIAAMAGGRVRAGECPLPDAIRPLYVRRSDAELTRDARARG